MFEFVVSKKGLKESEARLSVKQQARFSYNLTSKDPMHRFFILFQDIGLHCFKSLPALWWAQVPIFAAMRLFLVHFKSCCLKQDCCRWFFQQLIVGVDYLHRMEIASRDIKLENTLLDTSPRPLVKICDFGYSKVCQPSLSNAASLRDKHKCLRDIHRTSI